MPLGELAQARAEHVLADRGGVLDDALVLHGVDRGDGGGAGERVPGVGEAAGEDALVEGRGDRVGDDDAAERHVAGVDALGEGDQVGRHAEVVEGEPLAGAAEAGHDLVGDEDDAVPVAELADAREVAGRRDQDAGGADDGLEDDRGDRAGALELDDLLEVLQRALALLLGVVDQKRER